MIEPSAPPLFPGHPAPGSVERRRFRALARSAPWLTNSLRLKFHVPELFAAPDSGLIGELDMIIRQREAIAVRDETDRLVYQKEFFTADRGRDYVAASLSSWQLPASLTSPVYTDEHLILRRPEIAGFGELLPLDFLATMLDPYELAGTEPASLELAFDHPTFIHELVETTFNGRKVLAAVLTQGYSYKAFNPEFQLVPPGSHTLIMLDRVTGVCVKRQVLTNGTADDDLELQIIAHNEYYIDSLFTSPAPTLTDVRAPIPWELRND
ncbi:hypothetical protein [Glutamicibacter sp.]|uniref:hypothetical protein n=1 Tax=Glutamicibacter sp. TaxID=1931995 RepID=UPI0028BF5AB5|nr:hypothetical protein [Glutamicibacter sp.]